MFQTPIKEAYFNILSQTNLMFQTLMQEGYFVEAGAVNGVLDSNSLVGTSNLQHLKY